jgi:hypothetical protein
MCSTPLSFNARRTISAPVIRELEKPLVFVAVMVPVPLYEVEV